MSCLSLFTSKEIRIGSNISTYSEYSKPNNLYRIDAQQLVENTKNHKAERHHIPLPEDTITSRSESVLSASNLNRSFSNLLRVSPKPIAEMECTNISSNMDKSLPKLPVEMWLQILKDSVLNETDRDNFAMVSKLHYRIYKSVMNITIYFLYSSAASKIFTDNDLKILQEQAHNGQITEASFSNTKMFKKMIHH